MWMHHFQLGNLLCSVPVEDLTPKCKSAGGCLPYLGLLPPGLRNFLRSSPVISLISSGLRHAGIDLHRWISGLFSPIQPTGPSIGGRWIQLRALWRRIPEIHHAQSWMQSKWKPLARLQQIPEFPAWRSGVSETLLFHDLPFRFLPLWLLYGKLLSSFVF